VKQRPEYVGGSQVAREGEEASSCEVKLSKLNECMQ
jgi:hypothetical protein